MDYEEITLHGHRVSYRRAGWGPVIVRIHGITGSSQTWEHVIEPLAEHYTVVAPDLLGHGESAKPRGDYSLGAYASGIRDLIAAIGHDRATIVGHSLGGGVAMQMAYQFPERCERLVLVSSGGLGREVHLMLRAAVLPGSELVLPLLASSRVLSASAAIGSFFTRLGMRAGPDLEELWRGFSSLNDVGARAAFIHTLRGIVDPGGQRVNATDRLYLAERMPTMLLWGERDPIIPVEHGRAAQELIPGCRFEAFPGAGHFPPRTDPRAFVRVLDDLIESTQPAAVSEEDVEVLKDLKRFIDAGLDEEGIEDATRVVGESMSRVARTVAQLTATSLLRPGVTEHDLGLGFAEAARQLVPLFGRQLEFVFKQQLLELVRTEMISRQELESGLPDAETISVSFADLVGFTKLGEELPPEEIGRVAGRLSELAADVAQPPVQLVKTIGDAAMLVSTETEPLGRVTLGLARAADDAGGDFPMVRAGVARRGAVGRGGGWYGRPGDGGSRGTRVPRPGSGRTTESLHEETQGPVPWAVAG